MDPFNSARRELLRFGGMGLAAAAATTVPAAYAATQSPKVSATLGIYDVRTYGAVGDGKTVDSPAINKAIEAAAAAGGGTVLFPAGTWLCFSIRLKSHVALYLSQGATILAADSPLPGATTGYNGGTYDAAEPNTAWDAYQDYGHNHWHNSLIWGEDIHDVSITGPGLIYGKGLSFGAGPGRVPPGAGFGPIAPALRRTDSTDRPSATRQLHHVPGRAARRRQQSHRAEKLPQRPLPRLLHPQGRPLRPSSHRRRQPHHRQPHHRHRPRRHRHRLLPERPRLQLHRQLALGRRASAPSPATRSATTAPPRT